MSDITKLREHLFATMEGLKNGGIDVEKARAMADVAQTIINTAKLEVEFLRVTGAKTGTGFMPITDAAASPESRKSPTATGMLTHNPDGTTSHRMR